MGEIVPFDRAELQVISEPEAAGLLGVHPATLARMRKAGGDIGPRHVKLSARRIGYRIADIRRYLGRQPVLASAAA